MKTQNEQVIDELQWEALAQQARRFTYCLVDRTNAPHGTASAVRIGTRYFLASAKHVIESASSLVVLARKDMVYEVSDFAASHVDGQLDIGVIELAPAHTAHFDFVDVSRLNTAIDMTDDLPALVVGYPAELGRSAETQLTSNINCRVELRIPLTYRTVILPVAEWREGGLTEPLAPERDLLVDFQDATRIKLIGPGIVNNIATTAPSSVDPHGMSGGGIWLAQVADHNGLWISDVRLVGIQTGWYRRAHWLRGIQISAWLDLVRRNYADLAEQ